MKAVKSNKSDKYIELMLRRETLEAKVQEKENELRRICFVEAEITGEIPYEISLNSVPKMRKRVGTSYTLPHNLIQNLKPKKDDSVTNLELDFQLQLNVVNATQRMAKDKNVKYLLRRQRNREYSEQLKKLEYLQEKLTESKLELTSKKSKTFRTFPYYNSTM